MFPPLWATGVVLVVAAAVAALSVSLLRGRWRKEMSGSKWCFWLSGAAILLAAPAQQFAQDCQRKIADIKRRREQIDEVMRLARQVQSISEEARDTLVEVQGDLDALGARLLAMVVDKYRACTTDEEKERVLRAMVELGPEGCPMILEVLERASDPDARRDFIKVLERIIGRPLLVADGPITLERVRAIRRTVEAWLREQKGK